MNDKAAEAQKSNKAREELIKENEQIILKIASKTCGKYVTKSDDEWSVALIAFNRAIDSYSPESGDFAAYSGRVMKNALIDHHRSEVRYASEITVSDEVFSGAGEYEENSEIIKAVVRDGKEEAARQEEQGNIREEILEVSERLQKYGFTFYDVAKASPKAEKTKQECGKVLTYILSDPKLTQKVIQNGRLPAKDISRITGAAIKLLDRYRKYLVMGVVILNGEYPLLADYLKYINEGKEGAP